MTLGAMQTSPERWGEFCMAYLTRVAAFVILIVGSLIGLVPAHAQAIPKSLQGGTDPEASLRERKNLWTVGLAGGLFEGTFMRFAEELRKVLDDGDEMRLLPIVSRGSAANLEDLLYLRGVDIAVTQVDIFEYFRTQRKIPNLEQRVHYLLRFPVAEVQLITRKEITSIEQLRGKKVHFATPGGASTITGVIAFQRLGIEVEQVTGDIAGGVDELVKGEVDALMRVVQKPVGYLQRIPANLGLHMLSIPYSKKFTDLYALAEITNSDYPNLVPPNERVDTIAVPSVLAVYNWSKNTDRYRRVERFVQRLFANFDKLQNPPYHPKWKDVNLAASIPGWTRFSVAETELTEYKRARGIVEQPTDMETEFRTFVGNLTQRDGKTRSSAELQALFREFLQWRDRQGGRPR
jgi:TRAP-type uncharacterized transport system substrate-binding protein